MPSEHDDRRRDFDRDAKIWRESEERFRQMDRNLKLAGRYLWIAGICLTLAVIVKVLSLTGAFG